MRNRRISVIVALALTGLIGCTRHTITNKVNERLFPASTISIGDITDRLPYGFDPKKKPTWDQIKAFKTHLALQIADHLPDFEVAIGNNQSKYDLTGDILAYNKGSGKARLAFGTRDANSRISFSLKLMNRETEKIVFGGVFHAEVIDGFTKGEKVFEEIAKDFALALLESIVEYYKD